MFDRIIVSNMQPKIRLLFDNNDIPPNISKNPIING